MSPFSSAHSAKSILLALALAVAVPVGLGVTGCSEAPKLAKRDEAPQSSKPSAPAPTAGGDETENLPKPASPPKKVDTVPVDKSGRIDTNEKPGAPVAEPKPGGAEPGIADDEPSPAAGPAAGGGSSAEGPPRYEDKSMGSQDDAAQESRSAGQTPSDDDYKAREAIAKRAAEEEARWRAQQEESAGAKNGASTEAPPKKNGNSSPDIATQPPSPSPVPPASGEGSGRGVSPPPPPKMAEKPDDPNAAYDVVPVFYGTDRAVQPDPQRLQFGSERGHKLQLGRALITVPKAHKVPDIERPWVVEIPYFKVKIYEEAEDPNKHFTLQEISALTKEQLLVLVKERLAKSKTFKDHAFIFIHGFNTSFDYALFRTAQISYDMKFDGAPFVYSWPSGGKVASYTYDRGSAEQAEPHLAEFINLVVKETGAKSISLIAHSMGNELLLRVLERLRPTVPKGVVISQVILAAPDVDRDKFDNIAREITNFSKGVTLYAASNDRALGYSARFWGGVPRAGDVPATGPMIVPGVDTIDVTAVSTDSLGLNHSGYAENNALLADIKLLLLAGVRPPDKRLPTLLKLSTTSGGAYWKFPAPK